MATIETSGCLAKFCVWMRPIRPMPIIPMPMRSLAPETRDQEAAVRAVAAPALTNVRRLIFPVLFSRGVWFMGTSPSKIVQTSAHQVGHPSPLATVCRAKTHNARPRPIVRLHRATCPRLSRKTPAGLNPRSAPVSASVRSSRLSAHLKGPDTLARCDRFGPSARLFATATDGLGTIG